MAFLPPNLIAVNRMCTATLRYSLRGIPAAPLVHCKVFVSGRLAQIHCYTAGA
jgi:hypothetical protein